MVVGDWAKPRTLASLLHAARRRACFPRWSVGQLDCNSACFHPLSLRAEGCLLSTVDGASNASPMRSSVAHVSRPAQAATTTCLARYDTHLAREATAQLVCSSEQASLPARMQVSSPTASIVITRRSSEQASTYHHRRRTALPFVHSPTSPHPACANSPSTSQCLLSPATLRACRQGDVFVTPAPSFFSLATHLRLHFIIPPSFLIPSPLPLPVAPAAHCSLLAGSASRGPRTNLHQHTKRRVARLRWRHLTSTNNSLVTAPFDSILLPATLAPEYSYASPRPPC